MSAEWVTAIATMGTFVVIAASAVAALLQLNHMRGSNQIVALTECRETLESDSFQEARHFVLRLLPEVLNDSEIRRRLVEGVFPTELRQAQYVANFFESMGAFVRFNIIDRTIACDLWSTVVLGCWEALRPVTRALRHRDPGVWENFEYLAMLSKQYLDRFPTAYPAGMPRMDLGEDV